MTLRASCFNRTVICKNLARLWPALVLFGAGMLYLWVLIPIKDVAGEAYNSYYYAYENIIYQAPIMTVAAALCCAGYAFDFLHKKKSCHYFHSLPLNRKTLFCSAFLSGVLVFLLPLLFSALFGTLLITLRMTRVLFLLRLHWECMAYILCQFLVFYAIAVLSMVLCGRNLHSILTYLCLNFLVPVVCILLSALVAPCTYGIEELVLGDGERFAPILVWFEVEPFTRIYDSCRVSTSGVWKLPWIYTGICVLCGGLLVWLSYRIFRRAMAEHAEQGIAIPSFHGPLSYFLTLVLGCALTMILLLTFHSNVIDISDLNLTVLVTVMLLCSLPCFFLMEMLLKRTKKVFTLRNVGRFGCYVAFILIFVLCFSTDLFGIVRKVPEAEKVESVQISFSTRDYSVEDAENIEAIRSLHQQFIDARDALEEEEGSFDELFTPRITYTLKNGRTVERYYKMNLNSKNPEVKALSENIRAYFSTTESNLRYIDEMMKDEVHVELYIPYNPRTPFSESSKTLTAKQRISLVEAMKSDARAGNFSLFLYSPEGEALELRIGKISKYDDIGYWTHIYIPKESSTAYALVREILGVSESLE